MEPPNGKQVKKLPTAQSKLTSWRQTNPFKNSLEDFVPDADRLAALRREGFFEDVHDSLDFVRVHFKSLCALQ